MNKIASATHTAADWEQRWMPRWPLASDHPAADGVYRMSRNHALERRYLEHSPSAFVSAVVIDCDHEDAALRAFERPSDHPQPNWVALSPSGRGHLGWWLAAPVCRTDAARQAPLRYLARTQEGLRRCVDGDPAYVGLLTKNPAHTAWETIWGAPEPYDLRDLHTIHTPRQLTRRPDRAVGLGRNCTMFDAARREVYPLHRHYAARPFEDWRRVVVQHCHAVNSSFSPSLGGPLPFSEVQATANSIAGWVWKEFRPFSEIQAERGRKGGLKGGKTMTEKRRQTIIETNKRRAVDRAAILAELEA